MAVWYLDNDDEITDAVARLRNADDEQVVFVVPPGSRIATGRINFKLLAREAESRSKRLAIASPDEQVRALASSAGVLVAVSPDLAEAALERGDTAPEPDAVDVAVPETVLPATTAAPEPAASRFAWRSRRIRLATLAVLVLALVGGFVAWQTLPTAEVTLVPRVIAIGPLEVAVTATATVDMADVEAGLAPAVLVPISLSAESDYTASGTEVTESRATGTVVFSAPGADFERPIAAGTRVLTSGDPAIAFATTGRVVLEPTESDASEVSVGVEAVAGGEAGNREPGEISIVPPVLADQGISVTNPEGTSGGATEQQPVVLPDDYEAAKAEIENQLQAQTQPYLDDPTNIPQGLTVFPESVRWEPVTLEPTEAAIVGTEVASFTLRGTMEGVVLAVDEGVVDELLRDRLHMAVPEGMALAAESIVLEIGEGRVDGEAIAFDGTATGRAATIVDRDDLLGRIAGLPVSEAQAILDALGSATVNVWPGIVGDLPEDRQRITLDVSEPTAPEPSTAP
jgi:hypothetical protein